MKRLLIATDSFLPRWDGIARFLNEIIPALRDEYDVTVVAPDFPGDFTPDGFEVVRIPLSIWRVGDYRLPKAGKRTIKRLVSESDMIWSQTVGPIGARAVLYASRKGVPAACYVHSIEWELVSMSISRPYLSRLIVAFIRYLTRWIYNKASLLMVPSMEVSHLLERNNVRTRKELVRMGIDSAKFRPPESKEEAKRMIGMDPRDLVIGFIGRIGREKGLMTLYDAFVRNRNEFGSARLLIVGSGLSDWENVFRSAPGVKLVGATNHAVDYIQAMDIYVLPSFTETTSLSTLEAMSCGCAVLSTKVGLAKRYIKDKVNGSFFPAGNDTVLRLKLKWLIESPELRESMGESARRTVITSFDWSKTSEGVKRSLRSLG